MVIRFFNLAIRVLQFLDAAVILGIFSYFLAVQSQHNQPIPTWMKAVEGLSGAATLYGLLGSLFTCCVGGLAFFAFLAIVLDVCFIGAMIAIAVMTRDGTQSCSGNVNTPLGSGADNIGQRIWRPARLRMHARKSHFCSLNYRNVSRTLSL